MSKQGYTGQGLEKYEQGTKVPINPPSQASIEGLGNPSHSPKDDLLRVPKPKDYFEKNKLCYPSKGSSSSNYLFFSYHQNHSHHANDCPNFKKRIQGLIDNGTIRIIEDNLPPSNYPCPTSQEIRPTPIDDQEKLATRIFWRLKYDNNVIFTFIKLNHNYKNIDNDEICLFYRSYTYFLRNRKVFKAFFRDQYDQARIALITDLALFLVKRWCLSTPFTLSCFSSPYGNSSKLHWVIFIMSGDAFSITIILG